jgi:mgtE-like transporter
MKEGTPVLIATALIHTTAGVTLQLRADIWAAIPAFLMLIPPLNGLGNNLACIISSRITTLLALGIIRPEWKTNKALKETLTALTIVAVLSSVYIAVLNFSVAFATGVETISLANFIATCIIAVMMLTLLVAVISITVAFLAWKKGLDPDNATIPISTTISDMLGILCLLIATRIVGLI